MRLISSVLLLFAISATAQGPTPNTPYVLTISTPTAGVVVGKPVEVQVTLQNSSHADATVVKSIAPGFGELNYDVAVVTATGAPVPLTPYGRALHHEPVIPPIPILRSPHELTLKPHEKTSDTILLNKIYELTPGDYIVRVQKTESTTSEPKVVSNTLRLTILPQ